MRFALACRTEPLDLILHESPLYASIFFGVRSTIKNEGWAARER